MALYEADLIEEKEIIRWHTLAPRDGDEAGKLAREAATPFIKWLFNAEEEEEADEGGTGATVEALGQQAQAIAVDDGGEGGAPVNAS